MTNTANALRLLLLAMALVLGGGLSHTSAKKRIKRTPKLPAAEQPAPENDEPAVSGDQQVQLRLCDGTLMPVDEAWESEQGIWYKKGGITHLVARDRVQTIERGSVVEPTAAPQIAKVTDVGPAQGTSLEQPVWIYLVGERG